MKTQKTQIIFFSFFLLASLINKVLAEELKQVNLLDIPYYLGVQLGVGTFAGGIIASAILFAICAMPILIITRGKGVITQIFMGFLILGVAVGIGWLPVWLYAVIILFIAFGFAAFMSKHIGG